MRLSQTILAQVDRDDCIIYLLEVMDDVYSFVKEAEPAKRIGSQGRIVAVMAQQTTECAYFIRDYAMNKSFCMSASALHAGESPTITLIIREKNPQKQLHVRCR